jgi:hypothetical protein
MTEMTPIEIEKRTIKNTSKTTPSSNFKLKNEKTLKPKISENICMKFRKYENHRAKKDSEKEKTLY